MNRPKVLDREIPNTPSLAGVTMNLDDWASILRHVGDLEVAVTRLKKEVEELNLDAAECAMADELGLDLLSDEDDGAAMDERTDTPVAEDRSGLNDREEFKKRLSAIAELAMFGPAPNREDWQ